MSDRTTSAYQQAASAREKTAAIAADLDRQMAKYEGILPSNIKPDVFRNAFLTAVQSNYRLLDADRNSLWLALQKAANDGLLPDGREGALVIFGDDEEDEDGNRVPSTANQKKKVVWMPMVWGLLKLVRNTGNIASIDIPLVYRGEVVELWYEDGKKHFKLVKHFAEDFDDSPENIIAAVAIVTYKDGSWDLEYASRRHLDRVRAVSRAKRGPWAPWYDEMARKVPLRRLMKRLDKSAVDKSAQVMDADESMAIDGEAVEIRQQSLPAPEVRAEPFTPEQMAASRQRMRTVEGRSKLRSQDLPRAAKEPSPADPPQPEPPPQEPPPAAAQDAPRPEFEAWVVDDIGEPVEGAEDGLCFTDPVLFARWFADTYAGSERPDALRENNADALAEAGAFPEALAIIEAALAARRATPPPAGDFLVPVPRTPRNSPHIPNYIAACREAIGRMTTAEQLAEWIAANAPTYEKIGGAIAIERAVKGRQAELNTTASNSVSDGQAVACDRLIADLAACKTLSELSAMAANGAVRAKIVQWRETRPDLIDRFNAAADEVEARLKGAG
jgi:recombination protein RecT